MEFQLQSRMIFGSRRKRLYCGLVDVFASMLAGGLQPHAICPAIPELGFDELFFHF
jgi:hypothetical protein